MVCDCEVTLAKGMDDSRASLWLHIFGKLSFPLKHPIRFTSPNFEGKAFYAGDANALSPEQKTRLIEAMSKKFNISAKEVENSMKDDIIPILDENLIVSICQMHLMNMMDFPEPEGGE